MRFFGFLKLASCVLAAMAVTAPWASAQNYSATSHPGWVYHARASKDYKAGHYFSALHYYGRSAVWGDKLSQFNLGVMHYQGQGTDRDPARAWAWFELAAERGYPQMTQMSGQVWSELTESERENALQIYHGELFPEYRDKRALARAERQMRRARRAGTGSMLGGITPRQACFGGPLNDPENCISGEQFYARENWDVHVLVNREMQLLNGHDRARSRVTVRDVEDSGDSE